MHYGNLQNEIYLQGLSGTVPRWPFEAGELEQAAEAVMTPEGIAYASGGAGSEQTMHANRAAFGRVQLVPRMLQGIEVRDLSTTVLGTALPAPVALAPVGVLNLYNGGGDAAAARAAASLGLAFTASTAASAPMEDIAAASGQGPRWYQLYWPRHRALAASFLERAERAGYSALLVTLDTWNLGWRPRDLALGNLPFLRGEGTANYFSDPVFRSELDAPPEQDLTSAVLKWSTLFSDHSLTWDDLPFLREHWHGPIALKGICSAEDARRAVDAGVDGVVVSNHGGRQVDGAVSSLAALPLVAEAVGGRCEVLFDSGIRTGADVVKALALGARAVLVGRPYVWGLALGGEEGVTHVLRALLADLDITMALTGCATPAELGPDHLTGRP